MIAISDTFASLIDSWLIWGDLLHCFINGQWIKREYLIEIVQM